MSTQAEVIDRFQQYIDRNGGVRASYGWYVGVSSQPRERLFRQHKVNEHEGAWIFAKADSSSDAWAVERHFLEHGSEGGSGGGDRTASNVYAYRVTWYTKEIAFPKPRSQPMPSDPRFQHNIQSREETAYNPTERELKSLGSFNFTAAFLLTVSGALASFAVTTATTVSQWTIATCAVVFLFLGGAVALALWCRREVLQGKELVETIKARPKPRREGNGHED